MNLLSDTLRPTVLSKFKANHNTFIETGTWLGGAVAVALQVGFEHILSIDVSVLHKETLTERFKDFIASGRIKLIYGDSATILKEVVAGLQEPSLFWLDAHYHGPGMAGPVPCPLYHELEAIGQSPIKGHTIMVDDLRLIRRHRAWANAVSLDGVLDRVKAIDAEYVLDYADGHVASDILVAHR